MKRISNTKLLYIVSRGPDDSVVKPLPSGLSQVHISLISKCKIYNSELPEGI